MATELFTHPTHDQLRAFAQGRLSSAEMTELERHIAHCDSCCLHLERVPDDTLVQLAREAATQGIKAPAATQAEPALKTSPGEIPKELRDHPRYRVLSLVGHGGMGAVYKAEHRMMERLVALKVINPALLANPHAVERFNREFRAAGKLSHPNIVAAYDADQAGDLHFFVMEFVDGISLDRLVAHNGPLAPMHAAYLVHQAAQGLQHAHEKGMVHRDIKPQNLMMTRQKKVKILDFGLIRLGADQVGEALEGDHPSGKPGQTTAGMVLGTPDYIAPEQATDARTADGRADIYSLGCTLFYLLTGKPPFPGGSTFEKIHGHLKSAPPPIQSIRSDVPAELVRVLDKMLAKDPAKRYQTPGELAKVLAPLAKGQGRVGRAPRPPEGSGRRGSASAPESPAIQVAAEDPLVPLPSTEDPVLSDSPFDDPALVPLGFTPPAAVAIGVGSVALLAMLALAVSAVMSGNVDPPNQIAQQQSNVVGSSGNSHAVPPSPLNTQIEPAQSLGQRRLLLVVPNQGLWYPDYMRVKEELVKKKIEVVTVSTSLDPCQLMPSSPAGVCVPDRVLDNSIRADDYDGIIFAGADTRDYHPGGIRGRETRSLVTEFKKQNKILAAICAGQRVLALYGELTRKKVAKCNFVDATFGDTSSVIWNPNVPALTDGQVITARGDRDAADLAEEIARYLDQ